VNDRAISWSLDMPQIASNFDSQKAIEIILYIANRVPSPTKLVICKLIYFADKTSLEKYGRFVSGDNYAALPHGPVPSRTLNLINEAVSVKNNEFSVDGIRIIPKRDAIRSWFSDSDIECLDKIIEQNKHKPAWQIGEESHQDPAYIEAWARRGLSNSVPIKIENIAKHFDDSDALVSFLTTRHQE
jgi:uncharacterized phage-associated protein